MATQGVAVAGIITVAKVRITRYLTRANKDYFIPRGLFATVAKQQVLDQFVEQHPGAPLLVPATTSSAGTTPLYERRLMAMQGSVAPPDFYSSSNPSQQGNILDIESAKQVAFSARRQENKLAKKAAKGQEEVQKIEREIQKCNRKAEEEQRRKPSKAGKIEGKRIEEVAKLEKDLQKEKANQNGEGDGGKALANFLFIVVTNFDPSMIEEK